MTDRRDDVHLLHAEREETQPAALRPTEPTLEGIARGIDEARKDARAALRQAVSAALYAEAAKNATADIRAEVEKRQAPPVAAVWTQAAGMLLASLSTTAMVVLLGWWLISFRPPPPHAPAVAPAYIYAYPQVGP